MAIQNYPKKWLFKPPVGTPLNFGHPLAKGMVGCWMFNENVGFVKNLVNGVQWPVNNYLSPNWVPSTQGTVWRNTSNVVQNNYNGLMSPVGFPMSVVCIFSLTNIASLNGAGFLFHTDAADTTTGYHCDFTFADPAVMRIGNVGQVATNFSNLTIGSANNFVWYIAVWTVDKSAGTATGYLGKLGQAIATQAVAAQAMSAGTITTTWLMDSTNGLPAADSMCSEILFYNRVLTSGEVSWLNADPYAFMMPKVRRQNKQATVVAGATLVPQIFQNPMNTIDLVTV
jgi:hypothetical protein